MGNARSRAGRPRGTFGDLSLQLIRAAQQGPGTVRELAERAQVSADAARFRASRLVACGALVPVADRRPRLLAVPEAAAHDETSTYFFLAALWRG